MLSLAARRDVEGEGGVEGLGGEGWKGRKHGRWADALGNSEPEEAWSHPCTGTQLLQTPLHKAEQDCRIKIFSGKNQSNLLAGRANKGAWVEPVILDKAHLQRFSKLSNIIEQQVEQSNKVE